jgi:dienelactone hydrolase
MKRACGSWPSVLSARVLAEQGLRLSAVAVLGDDTFWIEGRPNEDGRNVLVRRTPDGRTADAVPAGFNVRTRVHEYGGGAYLLDGNTVFFANYADQRLYRGAIAEAAVPEAITAAGEWRYADCVLDRARQRLICVREDHTQPNVEAVTTLVGIALDGGAGSGTVLAAGYDFYSSPCVSPDGALLAWLCWRHPNMPWDGTELWIAGIAADGALRDSRCVAGSVRESIYQPGWSPDGDLIFASDRDNWWRLYVLPQTALRAVGMPDNVQGVDAATSGLDSAGALREAIVPVLADPPANAEFGRPQWIFGTATWRFVTRDEMVVSYTSGGRWKLGTITRHPGSTDAGTRGGDAPRRALLGVLHEVPTTLEPDEWLATTATHAVLVAGSPTVADAVVTIDLATGAAETLRASSTLTLPAGTIATPESLMFPTAAAMTAHAFYYAPCNPECAPLPGEVPPLIVIGHGGPIAAAQATLDLKIQFWTSRGFAVVDVNYGGSTGFGRAYRERLNGQWGVVDVADLIAAAQHLVREGKADGARLAIRGGSAGGYTTLAALTMFPDVFAAGASYYGISDLELLLSDSHKFESRCLDILVGPYPAMKDVYRERSPIHHVDRLSCPLILFQGLEDKVVPPNQSEAMAAALRAKGQAVAYLAFAGEQHGFRKAATIVRSQEAELYFYGAVFGFTAAGAIEPVAIDNLQNLPPRFGSGARVQP